MAVQAAAHFGGPVPSWHAGLLHPFVLQLPAQACRAACLQALSAVSPDQPCTAMLQSQCCCAQCRAAHE